MKYLAVIAIGCLLALIVAWGYEDKLLASITCAAIGGVTALGLCFVYANDHRA